MAHRQLPGNLCARTRSAGLSLVELMVAIAIGLLILTGMLLAYNSGSATTRTSARYAEVQTNGRYAIDFLRREIQHAGYLAYSTGFVVTGGLEANDYGCGTGFVTNLAQWIWGSNEAMGLGCIDATDYASNSDVLVLRRAGLTPATGNLAANTLYARTEFKQAQLFVGTTAPDYQQAPFEDYPVSVSVYYVSPNTSGSDGIPALKRMTLATGATAPAMSAGTVIASGVENMQVQYGVLASGSIRYYDAQNVPNWTQVVGVRLWLLVRSSDQEYGGYATSPVVPTMGDHTPTSNPLTLASNYVYDVFPLVVNLRK